MNWKLANGLKRHVKYYTFSMFTEKSFRLFAEQYAAILYYIVNRLMCDSLQFVTVGKVCKYSCKNQPVYKFYKLQKNISFFIG